MPAPPAIPPFVDHCAELLAPLGAVRSRRMFGGWGLYVDGIFIALIAGDRLYLKAATDARARFASAGCEPFVFHGGGGKAVSSGYWSAPAQALDSPAAMAPWAALALQAALAARAASAGSRHGAASARSPAAIVATPKRAQNAKKPHKPDKPQQPTGPKKRRRPRA